MKTKPKVVLSKCINYEHCRFNGGIINDEFVKLLEDYVDFVPLCPEAEIGLGVPRDALKLVLNDNKETRIIQTKTKIDFTDQLQTYAKNTLSKIDSIDGFILKNRSPSCGINDAKIYPDVDNKIQVDKGPGIFGAYVMDNYSDLAVVNEGQLRNFNMREDFLINLFTIKRFKDVKETKKLNQLIEFHANHKYLFMAYNEHVLRELGKITANTKGDSVDKIFDDYEKKLGEIFNKSSKYTTHINTLQHCFGYVSDELSAKEKDFFMKNIKKYRNGKIPLSVLLGIMESWILKYNVDYLENQYYFKPYPEDLMIIKDSGTGRDL